MQWPPRKALEFYDFSLVDECLAKHKPVIADIQRFEWTTDFKNLPDSRELKCYLHCLFVKFHLMNEQNSTMDFIYFLEFVNQLTREEQNIYLKMRRKCGKKYKDPCEMAYYFNLCLKNNYNEYYYTFWKPNLDP